MAKNQKNKLSLKTIWRLLLYFAPFKFLIVFFAIMVILSSVSAIVGPQIIGGMINLITKNFEIQSGVVRFNPDFSKITELGFILIAIYVGSGVFGYVQNWIMGQMVQKIVFKLRDDSSKKIARLPLSYFDKHKTGDIVSIITNDIETLSNSLSESLNQLSYSIITIVGVTIMMISISWQMSLIALTTGIISVGIIMIISKFSQVYFTDLQKFTSSLTAYTEEMLSSHEVIKVYNGEKSSVEDFEKINNKMYISSWKSQFFGGLLYPIMGFINNLSTLTVVVVGGVRALSGQMTIGEITAFMQYMSRFTQPISNIANSMTSVQTTVAACERIFGFLGAEEETFVEISKTLPKEIKGSVEFSKVNFSYSKNKPIITNFSTKIAPRSNVAIVGPTGAGKTTLVNLLMRFYDIDSGKITIDGIDTSKMSRHDVRSLFGMVLQDTWLFNGTIAENLAYGKPDATREEIIEAAKAAHADHFIRTLPKGYDTVISEDVDNVSVGEKQLLTIARAILADSPMLILDEATSSVDTRTEAAIQSAMDNLTHGRTSFVIAHRLSTIRNAGLILVLEHGNIVEQGSHKELLSKNGTYAKLYNSQFAE
ncbi:MAG: ABC transporter ATP-binding protein [Candidatus Nanogingivalis sp.]